MVDPYLGSEALGRIVIRHGNETMSLSIVVSPADVDPDAAELDAKGDPDRHVVILRATAEEFANQLCGAVSIIHVRRGQGRRQAFHDRYFGLIGRRWGLAQLYLLSNSLNKAAGDWPFAVVEFDRVNSWKIFAYVRGLVSGSDRGRSLVVDEVWPGTAKPKDAETGYPRTPIEPLETTSPLSIFKQGIRRTYFEVHELVEQRGIDAGSPEVNATIDKLIADWPATDDPPEVFAKLIVEGVLGREQHAATIADQLMKHSKFQPVALAIDSLLVECLLDRLVSDASMETASDHGTC